MKLKPMKCFNCLLPVCPSAFPKSEGKTWTEVIWAYLKTLVSSNRCFECIWSAAWSNSHFSGMKGNYDPALNVNWCFILSINQPTLQLEPRNSLAGELITGFSGTVEEKLHWPADRRKKSCQQALWRTMMQLTICEKKHICWITKRKR